MITFSTADPSVRWVDSEIWSDEKFMALSLDGKLVFLYLLTSPALEMFGVMRATVPGIAAEIKMPPGRFKKAFQSLLDAGLVGVDEEVRLFAIPNLFRYRGTVWVENDPGAQQ